MVHFRIVPGTGVPNYRQIMDQVKYYVASATLRPGDGLPSIRQLAGRLSLNPSTIVKAYGELTHEGVIEMKQGTGAFIAAGAKKLPLRQVKSALRNLLRQASVEARQMGVSRELVVELLEDEMDRLEKGGDPT